MQSKAPTVDAFLKSLPAEKRAVIAALRKVIRENMDKGYQEGMAYGMPAYFVPHSIYPDGYHCDPRLPLCFAGMMSQKNYFSIYLPLVYSAGESSDAENQYTKWFKKAWLATGKKLDMGKVCIRFKSLDEVPLEVVGEAIRRMPVKDYIAGYEKALGPERVAKAHKAAEKLRAKDSGANREAKAASTAAVKKTSAKKPSTKTTSKATSKPKAATRTKPTRAKAARS